MNGAPRDRESRVCRKRPSRQLKACILESQDGACLSCEEPLATVEFDHIVPLGIGGGNAPDNWAALCPACHRTKTASDLRRIAKAKRQRRYHETGRSRPIRNSTIPGIGASRGFDRSKRKHLNGLVVSRCACAACSANPPRED